MIFLELSSFLSIFALKIGRFYKLACEEWLRSFENFSPYLRRCVAGYVSRRQEEKRPKRQAKHPSREPT